MTDKELGNMELNTNELDNVTGGCYVNVSMTIGDIIGTDRNLANILAQSGISTFANKTVKGMTLYEAAESMGVDPYTIENIMNDYLDAK